MLTYTSEVVQKWLFHFPRPNGVKKNSSDTSSLTQKCTIEEELSSILVRLTRSKGHLFVDEINLIQFDVVLQWKFCPWTGWQFKLPCFQYPLLLFSWGWLTTSVSLLFFHTHLIFLKDCWQLELLCFFQRESLIMVGDMLTMTWSESTPRISSFQDAGG